MVEPLLNRIKSESKRSSIYDLNDQSDSIVKTLVYIHKNGVEICPLYQIRVT